MNRDPCVSTNFEERLRSTIADAMLKEREK